MTHTRLATLILTATITLSLVAASLTLVPATASASAPEFNPGTANSGIGDGSTVALQTTSGTIIRCLKASSKGEITGPKTVGNVVVTFHNCSSTEDGGCSIKSEGGPNSSLVITKTLDGELGSVKPAQAASGVGLLILPTTGTVFVTLEGSCLPVSPSPVDGSIAAEVTPVNAASSKDGKLILQGSGAAGVQLIKEINVLGTVVKPALKSLGLLETSGIGVELALITNPVTVT
jgi:hypothetical protein